MSHAAAPTTIESYPARRASESVAQGGRKPRTGRWRRWPEQPWWPWLIRLLVGMLFAVAGWLIFRQARTIDWPAVWQALRHLPASALALGAAVAVGGHLTYGSFDWIGRHCSGHRLSRAQTLRIAMTSYPFTLTLGSLIGGVGVRYRLYARRGVGVGTIGQVVATSIATNWLGYLLLAGALVWAWSLPSHVPWAPQPWQWRTAGSVLAALALAYVTLCWYRNGRPVTVRGHSFSLPRWRVVLWQLAASTAHWMWMGAALWAVLQQQVSYPAAMATVMLAAVAGLALRVPAGLGVLETVGVTLLAAGSLGREQVLAALLAYRGLYYFAPLVLAAMALGSDELQGRSQSPESEAPLESDERT